MGRCIVVISLLVLCGCATPPHAVVYRASDAVNGSTPNLVLGSHPADVLVASSLNWRSSWPSVEAGYWFDDTSFFVDVQADQQYQHGRLGGYYRTTQAVRTGVLVR
jgi:hypothetical protein